MTFSEFLNVVEFYTGNKNWFTDSRISISQREIVEAIHKNRYSIIYKGRQDGVSTILSLYILWRAIDTPQISVALISHSNSREIFRQNLNWNLQNLEIKTRIHNQTRTTLNNGSNIFYFNGQFPEKLIGHSVDIIVFDDLPTDYLKRFSHSTFSLPTICRQDGKIIIATSTSPITGIMNLDFQEVYGHFFNVKRNVLTEKLRSTKNLEL